MDILGPFPMANGSKTFLIVAIDYFTNWIEAKTLANITTKQVTQFFWENVIFQYGLPWIQVKDNGKQFNNEDFSKYYHEYGIDLWFTSMAHPQDNGHNQVANRIILDGLKKQV